MKYYGKEKCRILKEIRAEIAKANDIEWVVSECKHQGNCKGTCPKCEQEVRQLEAALARREALGKTVAVVGISAAISLSVTGCANPFSQTTAGVPPLDGGILPPENVTQETRETTPESDSLICETEMGEIAVPGEALPETETEPEELMGEPAWDGEYVEDETAEADSDEETDWDVLGGEPLPDDETEWFVTAGVPVFLPDDETEE
jgi:hypothetical protein